ncbi:MAG: hypothetical protein WC663_02670 [Patescibacteria group bacterium]|jgi:hypothetical protein
MKRTNNMLKIVAAGFVMFMMMFNFNPFYNYFYDEDEGVAYAQGEQSEKVEWKMLDAGFQGQNVAWKSEWSSMVMDAKSMVDMNPLSCVEVKGFEDVIGYGQSKQERLEIRVAGGEEPLRQDRARKRMIYVMSKIRETGLEGAQVKEGIPVINAPKGQRGAVITLIKDCIPKPPVACWDTNQNSQCDYEEDVNKDNKCDVIDCRGDDGSNGRNGKMDIDYDFIGQYMVSFERPDFYGFELRVNFPVSDMLMLGLGAEAGKSDGVAAAGFELAGEYDLNRYFKPRLSLVGRAFELDNHLYFGRGEIGGGLGFVGEFAEFDHLSLIYELRGEWKGELATGRREWKDVKSGVFDLGLRF